MRTEHTEDDDELAKCDEAFLADLEACRIPNAGLGHREHVRAAWAYIKRYGFTRGAIRMDAAIARFAAHHGHASKYHYTLTSAWMHLVAAHALPHPARTFDTFIETHGRLLDNHLIERFYSREALFSDCARRSWIEPDLRPLPDLA